jgi:GNAT superfamily N-acetyltransferase
MDAISLSLKMRRLEIWLGEGCQPDDLIRHQFDGAPFGHCYLTIDPTRQGETASGNYNRVYLYGREAGMDAASVARWIDLFREHGVKKFFVWLSPGLDMETVRGWLEAAGLSRVPWVRYPTLVRVGNAPVQFRTDLDIRKVTPGEIAAAREPLGKALWPEYVRSAGREGFFHYMAFDGARPVAIASLAVFEDMAYLLSASTREADRGRGAQQALIAARLARAEQLGCAIAVSETLNILEHSLRNLQRAGFREIYEKEVYAWVDPHGEERVFAGSG